MLFFGAPYPCICSFLPPTVLSLLFYVFSLVFSCYFQSISVTFGKKYYRSWCGLRGMGWIWLIIEGRQKGN